MLKLLASLMTQETNSLWLDIDPCYHAKAAAFFAGESRPGNVCHTSIHLSKLRPAKMTSYFGCSCTVTPNAGWTWGYIILA